MNIHDTDGRNTGDPDDGGRRDHDDAFDRAMRALHAQALVQVSPPVRARLRAARAAAATRPRRTPMRGFGWVLAGGFAAVFALAIGLPARGPAPGIPATQTAAAAGSDDGDDGSVATLDENPDFYLWLASNDDAPPVARER